MRLVLLAPLALAALPAAAADEASPPRPGQYRTTVELVLLELPNAPESFLSQARNAFLEGLAPPNDFCLAPARSGDAMRRKLLENVAEGDCTFSRFTTAGAAVSAAMSCAREAPGRGLVTIDGRIWAENADLAMNLEQDFEGLGPTRIVVRARSARVGDC